MRNREDGGVWRLGLAVTKKTGCAVIRNRVKRVVREFFRRNQTIIRDGFDMVIVPKRTLQPKDLTYAVAEQELTPLFVVFDNGKKRI